MFSVSDFIDSVSGSQVVPVQFPVLSVAALQACAPLAQRAGLVPAEVPAGPLQGSPSVAGRPGFCTSPVSQMLCFTSCSLYSKNQVYFCVFQIEMFVMMSNSLHPTLRTTAVVVSLPPSHFPVPLSKLLLTSSAFAVCHFPSSFFHGMLYSPHMSYLFIVKSTEKEI